MSRALDKRKNDIFLNAVVINVTESSVSGVIYSRVIRFALTAAESHSGPEGDDS